MAFWALVAALGGGGGGCGVFVGNWGSADYLSDGVEVGF